MLANETNPAERQYIVCMMRYCSLIESGMTRDEVLSTLQHLYTEAAAERVARETSDLTKIMETCFEKLPCPNCGTCKERGKTCQYEETKKLFIKVAKAMKKENVSQERLLELLRSLQQVS